MSVWSHGCNCIGRLAEQGESVYVNVLGRLAIVAGLIASLSISSSPSVGAEPKPTIVAGVISDDAGTPLAGVKVVAKAEHDVRVNGKVRSVGRVLATAVTDHQGRYALRGRLPGGPVTRNPDGSVRVEVTATSAQVMRSCMLNLHPPAPSSSAWAATPATRSDLRSHAAARGLATPSSTTLSLTLAPGSPVVTEPVTGPDVMVNPEATGRLSRSAPSAAVIAAERRIAGGEVCPGIDIPFWEDTPRFTRRWVPVHQTALKNRTKHEFDWSTTKNTSLSVAYEGPGGNYGGGLTKSRRNGSGVSDVRGGTNKTFQWNMLWKYRYQLEYCASGDHNPKRTGRQRWIPERWEGDNKVKVNYVSRFKCRVSFDRMTTTARQYWVEREQSAQWEGWFQIEGVKMNTHQEQTTSLRSVYEIKEGRNRAHLCGRREKPAYASFTQEQYLR